MGWDAGIAGRGAGPQNYETTQYHFQKIKYTEEFSNSYHTSNSDILKRSECTRWTFRFDWKYETMAGEGSREKQGEMLNADSPTEHPQVNGENV